MTIAVRVALAGCGAWGSNLLRVLAANPRASVVAVADTRARPRAAARALAPHAAVVATLAEATALGVDAVVVATPAHTHAALAGEALDAGADVFVEKPLAMNAGDAERCAERARALGRVGMVGHLLLYHPAVERLLDLARSGVLGTIRSVESARLSVAGDRSASTLWTLGPHDIAVLHALDASPISALTASGTANGDVTRLAVTLESGASAHILLSRAHATKERRLVVIGSEQTAVFDDVRAHDRVLVGHSERRRGTTVFTKTGEVLVAWREPLALEVDHFLRCVQERATPRTPLDAGVLVVRALARAEGAMQRGAGGVEASGWDLPATG